MNITEAMHAVSAEYDEEVNHARRNPRLNHLIKQTVAAELEEIDRDLPAYIAEIAKGMGEPVGTMLPDYVYMACVMCFRFGMRVQRKIDNPDQPTSLLWRTDQATV